MTGDTAEEIYHAIIMDRARRPRHQGRLTQVDAEAEERNPLCGDRVSVQVALDAESRITGVAHQARACAICMASADLIAEIVPGMMEMEARQAALAFEASLRDGETAEGAERLAPLRVFQPLREVPSRIPCAVLPFRALVKALDDR
jgi:nitrogen fixation NifU-like protein